jgi:hypothetical protein
MKLVTWNVNSLKVRVPRVLALQPNVVCMQETTCEDAAFPALELAAAGYARPAAVIAPDGDAGDLAELTAREDRDTRPAPAHRPRARQREHCGPARRVRYRAQLPQGFQAVRPRAARRRVGVERVRRVLILDLVIIQVAAARLVAREITSLEVEQVIGNGPYVRENPTPRVAGSMI